MKNHLTAADTHLGNTIHELRQAIATAERTNRATLRALQGSISKLCSIGKVISSIQHQEDMANLIAQVALDQADSISQTEKPTTN